MKITRTAMLGGLASVFVMPLAGEAMTTAEAKRQFISQCDESISVSRLAGAPYKFIGKKVDLHGLVGPAMADANSFNLDNADGNAFVIVIADARELEEGQAVRVLGVVQSPVSGQTTDGGSGTFAVIRARYVS